MKVNGGDIDYSRLPEHMREGAANWIEYGIDPGHFLSAVICNDLFEAYARADETNRVRMFDIVCFFYNDAPSGCYGSRAKMEAWVKARRAEQEAMP